MAGAVMAHVQTEPQPVLDHIARLLASLPPAKPLIAAVSGGSDSVALMGALAILAPRLGHQVVAVTIDHGLRAEAAGEARMVGALADRLGLRHAVLRWEGDKPATGIQSAAREARHDLLTKAAHELGAGHVLTGHSQDDQIETLLMRARRTSDKAADSQIGGVSSARGASGMAPATLHAGSIWFLRPLLDISRRQLREFAITNGLGWTDDPSNADLRFERVRMRAQVSALSTEERAVILAAGRRAAADRVVSARRLAGLVDAAVSLPRSGLWRIETGACPDRSTAAELVAYVATLAGGARHLPGAEARGRIEAFVLSGRSASFAVARALVVQRARSIHIHRERRNLHPIVIEPGRSAIWDGRFRVENHDRRRCLSVRAGGTMPTATRRAAAEAPAALVTGAEWAEPALCWQSFCEVEERLEDGCASIQPFFALHDTFLPVFDVTLAQAAARSIRREPYPTLPAGWVVDAV
jgi:tRNA(Ile)-lysidine synthase